MTEKKRPFKKIAAVAVISAGMVLASFGGTWAYYQSELSLVNPLSTPDSSVVMVEDFNPTQSFLPGETAVKKVWFENTGDMDLFLRVEVLPEEGWYKYGSDKQLVTAEGLEPSKVIKNWSDAWTEKKDTRTDFVKTPPDKQDVKLQVQKDEDAKNWGETALWTEAYQDTDKKYYRYYRRILFKKGSRAEPSATGGTAPEDESLDSTAPILESITLSNAVTNDRHDTNYSDKVYVLTFNAQAVPVEGEDVLENNTMASSQVGVETMWHMRVERDGNGQLIWTPLDPAGGVTTP